MSAKQSYHLFSVPGKNRGAVLFISLIMLLSLTIIGLSAMNNSFVELKSASNVQEKDLAYQAAQAGLDSVMCLGDQTRSGTTANNPFDKSYTIITETETDPSLKFDFEWDETFDAENVSPFDNVTQTTCSVNGGILSIGTTAGNETSADLAVAVRRIPNSASLRSIKGNSYEKLECHNYIIDSRYDYPTSGANASVWAGVCRQVGTGK